MRSRFFLLLWAHQKNLQRNPNLQRNSTRRAGEIVQVRNMSHWRNSHISSRWWIANYFVSRVKNWSPGFRGRALPIALRLYLLCRVGLMDGHQRRLNRGMLTGPSIFLDQPRMCHILIWRGVGQVLTRLGVYAGRMQK